MSRARLAVLIVLTASLHAAMLWWTRASPVPVSDEAATERPEGPGPAGIRRAAASCRGLVPPRAWRPRPCPDSGDDAGAMQGESDALEAQDCAAPDPWGALARAQMQAQWRSEQADIVAHVRDSLASEEHRRRDREQMVDRVVEHLGLTPEARGRFDDAYAPVRRARIDAIEAALSADPPAYVEIVGELERLYAAEDELAADLFGDDASQWLAEAERDSRAAVLAIAATFADVPWEELSVRPSPFAR